MDGAGRFFKGAYECIAGRRIDGFAAAGFLLTLDFGMMHSSSMVDPQ